MINPRRIVSSSRGRVAVLLTPPMLPRRCEGIVNVVRRLLGGLARRPTAWAAPRGLGPLRQPRRPGGHRMSDKATFDLWWKNAIVYCVDVELFADGDGDGCGDFAGLTG